MRRLRPLLFALAALAALAHAPDATAKKRPPPPRPKPAAEAGLRPPITRIVRPDVALPAATSPGAAFYSQGLAANGFANGGLRSGLPKVGDPAAQCRAACAIARTACDDDPGTPVCAPRWAQCVADCDR